MPPSHLRLVQPPEPPPAGPPPAAGEEPALAVTGLDAGYGRLRVLHNVDLTVPAGCITVLMGPGGAGKSTLVRAICGRLPARAGQVRICGVPVTRAEARGKIGLVPQDIALYPTLTIAENLSIFAELSGLGLREVRESVTQALDRTGTAARQDQRIDRLSEEWQRRANLAAALVGRPRLLLLDEPTAGMDALGREDLVSLLRTLAGEGLGVLLITQDFELAERVAERVAILKAGRLALEGAVRPLAAQDFAHRRLVELAFSTPPSQLQAGFLSALGFTVEGAHAHGLISDSPRAVSELLSRLDSLGLPPRALTLRTAGLAAIYGAITGRDA